MALLADPGVRIEHDDIYARLLTAGAKKGGASQVVRFPEKLVMECVERAPGEVFLADRRGGGRKISHAGEARIWSAPGMNILRGDTHRPFTSSDMAEYARLLDRLPNVDGVFGLSMDDIPAVKRDVTGLRIMAGNTSKHIRVLCFTPKGADILREMKDVLGAAPWFSVGFTAHGPLRWTNLALDIFARTAGHGIPTTINGEPMAGVSGPVTLAGSAAVGNAEILAGLVINQILEPGRPCIYNLGLAHVFDMRTAIAVTGAPENHLLADISAAMGRFYRVPSCSWVSTEAMCADSQAALEKALGFFTHINSGVSLIWGVGQLESELTVSPAQAVIDDEIIGYIKRYRRGIDVTDETLALNVTRLVGISGDYLSTDHTMEHFRGEFFEPAILFRNKRLEWNARGKNALDRVAEEKADELMREKRGPILAPDQERELEKLANSVGI